MHGDLAVRRADGHWFLRGRSDDTLKIAGKRLGPAEVEEVVLKLPGIGDADFACEQLGRRYEGTLRTRPTPNPNFRRVDAILRDTEGRPLLTVSTVLTRL